MEIPRLSDFSQKEIQLLHLAVNDKIETCQNNLRTLADFDDGEFKLDQLKYWNEQLEIYMLWRVQLLNAGIEVRKTELAKFN